MLEFSQGQCCTSKVLTLIMNILLPLFHCFGALRGPGLAHGQWLLLWPWLNLTWKGLAFVFPWIVENTGKTQGSLVTFPTLIPINDFELTGQITWYSLLLSRGFGGVIQVLLPYASQQCPALCLNTYCNNAYLFFKGPFLNRKRLESQSDAGKGSKRPL